MFNKVVKTPAITTQRMNQQANVLGLGWDRFAASPTEDTPIACVDLDGCSHRIFAGSEVFIVLYSDASSERRTLLAQRGGDGDTAKKRMHYYTQALRYQTVLSFKKVTRNPIEISLFFSPYHCRLSTTLSRNRYLFRSQQIICYNGVDPFAGRGVFTPGKGWIQIHVYLRAF